jgi:integrase
MPVYKRKYKSGRVVWSYVFPAPGSTRNEQRYVTGSGFRTKQAAIDAEAERRVAEQKRYELEKSGVGVSAAIPKTLGMLLDEFFRQHAEEKLAPKTTERYHEQAAYLSPELLAMPLADITPLHLSREWARLSQSGGHHRKTKVPRPLKAKTVRNIAGLVSSAFSRAIRWGLVTVNPATNSEPPRVEKHIGVALTPAQQATVFAAASGPWCMEAFLHISAALGARRGEVLALRWSDIVDGRAMISRSLTQTKEGLRYKSTKSGKPRVVGLPESTLGVLQGHRRRQDEFRQQFGPDYRADLDLIFANPDGSELRPDSVSAAVSLLCRRLKLPKGANLHSLRHTHTSHLLAKGVPLPVVSARLGHSSVRVTAEIYSHMIHGQDDQAAAAWDEYQEQSLADSPANSKPI